MQKERVVGDDILCHHYKKNKFYENYTLGQLDFKILSLSRTLDFKRLMCQR